MKQSSPKTIDLFNLLVTLILVAATVYYRLELSQKVYATFSVSPTVVFSSIGGVFFSIYLFVYKSLQSLSEKISDFQESLHPIHTRRKEETQQSLSQLFKLIKTKQTELVVVFFFVFLVACLIWFFFGVELVTVATCSTLVLLSTFIYFYRFQSRLSLVINHLNVQVGEMKAQYEKKQRILEQIVFDTKRTPIKDSEHLKGYTHISSF